MIEASSYVPRNSPEIFGHPWKSLENVGKRMCMCMGLYRFKENLRKVVGNLQKIVKNAVISMFMEWTK